MNTSSTAGYSPEDEAAFTSLRRAGGLPELDLFHVSARRSKWLSRRPASFQDDLLGKATIQRFSKNQTLIAPDETSTPLYFLIQGAVTVSVPRASLDLAPVHIIPAMQWFGEQSALTDNPSVGEFRTKVRSTALVVGRAALLSLREDLPAFMGAALDLFSINMWSYLELAGDLAGLGADDRVRAKLLTLSSHYAARPDDGPVSVLVSHEELAVSSCVSRATVAKVLSQLAERGIVGIGYRRIEILDPSALRRLVETDRCAFSP